MDPVDDSPLGPGGDKPITINLNLDDEIKDIEKQKFKLKKRGDKVKTNPNDQTQDDIPSTGMQGLSIPHEPITTTAIKSNTIQEPSIGTMAYWQALFTTPTNDLKIRLRLAINPRKPKEFVDKIKSKVELSAPFAICLFYFFICIIMTSFTQVMSKVFSSSTSNEVTNYNFQTIGNLCFVIYGFLFLPSILCTLIIQCKGSQPISNMLMMNLWGYSLIGYIVIFPLLFIEGYTRTVGFILAGVWQVYCLMAWVDNLERTNTVNIIICKVLLVIASVGFCVWIRLIFLNAELKEN